MNILITGASGFVGYRLCTHLSQYDNYTVYAAQRKQNDNSKYRYIFKDFSQPNWTSSLPHDIDAIIHLAQSKNYRSFPDKAEDIFTINVKATFELLEWARVNNVRKFIFSSTGNVYASQQKLIHEEALCEPASMYAASKLCCEHLIMQYVNFFDVFILRFFTIYGPMQQGMLIPSLVDKIKTKQSIMLANNKGLYITPLYIDDCINFLKGVVDLPPQPSMTIANLAGDEIISLDNVVSTIASLLDIEPIVAAHEGYVPWLCGTNEKIKNILGFGPRIYFNDGIKKTLEAWSKTS